MAIRKNNSIMYFTSGISIFLIILIFLALWLHSMQPHHNQDEVNHNLSNKESLKKNGYCCYKNVLSESEINDLLNNCIAKQYKDVKSKLITNTKLENLITDATDNAGYQFQDYIWIIQKSVVHTCHRDNNGDFFNVGQKYPSYTLLVYLEDMDKCLSVIPNSHYDKDSYFVNLTTPMTDILCKKGDVIIFNANLIHVGALNKKEDNVRIQMKVTHKDDIKYIDYYENFNKVLNQDNNLPVFMRKMQRSISCTFPGISDLTQSENIRTARGSDNADIGSFQKWFSYLFYGNKDFYDLPNAFN
jgi:hypothetical protein